VDFIRSIDGKFEQYDDSGMSPLPIRYIMELMGSGLAIDY
jgi:hypothetical protein